MYKRQAHAGNWHRQVSLLSYEKIEEFRHRGAEVQFGDFGENLVVEGYDFKTLPVGTKFQCRTVVLRMTQIGKECHHGCEIFQTMGAVSYTHLDVYKRQFRSILQYKTNS